METVTNENNPFFEHPPKQISKVNILLNSLQVLVVIAFIFIIIYLFIATPNQVDGVSMYPTFDDNQWVFTNRLVEKLDGTKFGEALGLNYSRGDVIVFKKPDIDHEIIKRIIGLPGDSIAIKNYRVYLNGRLIKEDYLDNSVLTDTGTFLKTGDEFTVPSGAFFVMGDNRPNSLDSRFLEIGFVQKDWVIGKVILRLLPLDQFTFVGTGKTELDNSSNF